MLSEEAAQLLEQVSLSLPRVVCVGGGGTSAAVMKTFYVFMSL